MLKAAIIGAGAISKVHLNAYRQMDDVRVVAVADPHPEKAEQAAAPIGANAYASVEALLAAEQPDIVDICTPTYNHADIAIYALERKVHVLCEKPMAIDVQSARKMKETADRNERLLMIAQVLRFWPEYAYLRKAVKDGTYGRLLKAHFVRTCQSPDSGNWFGQRDKSGLSPLDFHLHDVDFILHMLGKPKTVDSTGKPDDPRNNFVATRYGYDGMSIEAEGGWFDAPIPFEMSYRALFERAAMTFHGNRLTLFPRGGTPQEVDFTDAALREIGPPIYSSDGYFNEIKYFADCVQNNVRPDVCSAESTLESLVMVFREMESAKSNRILILN